MNGNVTFVWHPSIYKEIRTAESTQADIRRRAEAIARACGGTAAGYYARSSPPRNRARAAVITGTGKAIRDNAANNTIVKNLEAGK